jgi:hypothetical protein
MKKYSFVFLIPLNWKKDEIEWKYKTNKNFKLHEFSRSEISLMGNHLEVGKQRGYLMQVLDLDDNIEWLS